MHGGRIITFTSSFSELPVMQWHKGEEHYPPSCIPDRIAGLLVLVASSVDSPDDGMNERSEAPIQFVTNVNEMFLSVGFTS